MGRDFFEGHGCQSFAEFLDQQTIVRVDSKWSFDATSLKLPVSGICGFRYRNAFVRTSKTVLPRPSRDQHIRLNVFFIRDSAHQVGLKAAPLWEERSDIRNGSKDYTTEPTFAEHVSSRGRRNGAVGIEKLLKNECLRHYFNLGCLGSG